MRSSLCIGNVRVRTDLTTCFNFKGLKRFQIWIKQKPTKRNAYTTPQVVTFPIRFFTASEQEQTCPHISLNSLSVEIHWISHINVHTKLCD